MWGGGWWACFTCFACLVLYSWLVLACRGLSWFVGACLDLSLILPVVSASAGSGESEGSGYEWGIVASEISWLAVLSG